VLSNLLLAKEIPEEVSIIDTDIDYPTAKEILKDHDIFFHLKSKKLFFFGDDENIKELLLMGNIDVHSASIDKEMLASQWDVVKVLFYKALRRFLRSKGLRQHPWRESRVFMYEHRHYEEIPLIRENHSYYVHEGLDYKLETIGYNIYLVIVPKIVLTKDGYSDVMLGPNVSGIYTKINFNRWNNVTREMLEFWANYLSDDGIVVPIPNTKRDLIFENDFQSIKERSERRTLYDW